jgi:hypothetical protein
VSELTEASFADRRATPKHPDGWTPGVEWDGKVGRITSRPIAEANPDWTHLLETWGFDPAIFEVIEPVQVRTWDAAIGNGEVRTMWYHRAGIRQRRTAGPDVAELIAEISKHKPRPRPHDGNGASTAPDTRTHHSAFIYVMSDPQIGKKGTQATIERVLASYDAAALRIKELRRIGRVFDRMYFLTLGDLVEGCKDHYAMQTFEVEFDKRAQVRTARRLVVKGIETLAPLFPEVVLAGVGGNHGENRYDGKAYTTFADNADVEVIETAAEVLAAAPAYQHVRSVIPDDQLTVTLDIGGTIVALAHGHQARKGPTPQAKVKEWWKGQAFGMRPAGDATVLLTGHSHHLSIVQDGPRTHIQAPTTDSGSQWWEETAGVPSIPGALTLTIGPNGWDDLKLL